MIKYVIGDATEPQGEGNKLIIHCCNDVGGWGRGFVLALSRKWDRPEREYRAWAKRGWFHAPLDSLCAPFNPSTEEPYIKNEFRMGQIQVVGVDPYVYVVNMVGQRDYCDLKIKVGDTNLTLPPVRYGAITECLMRVAEKAKELDATVHCPRFGSALAGGEWELIATIIDSTLIRSGVEVTVYDLEG